MHSTAISTWFRPLMMMTGISGYFSSSCCSRVSPDTWGMFRSSSTSPTRLAAIRSMASRLSEQRRMLVMPASSERVMLRLRSQASSSSMSRTE